MMALPLENVSDSEEGQEDNGKPLVAQYRKQDLVGLVHWRSFLSSSCSGVATLLSLLLSYFLASSGTGGCPIIFNNTLGQIDKG